MESLVKDRSLKAFRNSGWGEQTWSAFNFDSHEQMCEYEELIMKAAKSVYPYVPKVISRSCQENLLTVEKIEGEHLDTYLKRTLDISVIDRLIRAVKQFHNCNISLPIKMNSRFSEGFIAYHDYTPNNFIIDKDGNIWFIDFNVSWIGNSPSKRDDLLNLMDLLNDLDKIDNVDLTRAIEDVKNYDTQLSACRISSVDPVTPVA